MKCLGKHGNARQNSREHAARGPKGAQIVKSRVFRFGALQSGRRASEMLCLSLLAPVYVRLGVRPAPLRVRSVAFARADALPVESLPLELQRQPTTLLPWSANSATPQPAAPEEAAAAPSLLVRVLHVTAVVLMFFPPIAALLCASSYVGTLVFARTPLLAKAWLRWWLVAETLHFLASKLTRWGQARKCKPPRMQSAERLSLWRACLADPTITAESFITGWFRDAKTDKAGKSGNGTATAASPPLSALRRDNVLDWLAWSLWGTDESEMRSEDRAELNLVFGTLGSKYVRQYVRTAVCT